MSPLDQLLQEAIPTRPEPAQPWGHWTDEDRDQHWQDLCDAVGTPNAPRPTPVTRTGCDPTTGSHPNIAA